MFYRELLTKLIVGLLNVLADLFHWMATKLKRTP